MREQEEAAWAARAAGDSSTIAALLDLASNPATAEERGRVPGEALQAQLAHVLALIGACAPETVLDRIGLLTNDERARATAIEVIGAIGDPAGLPWLAPLVDSPGSSWSVFARIPRLSARACSERSRLRSTPSRAGPVTCPEDSACCSPRSAVIVEVRQMRDTERY